MAYIERELEKEIIPRLEEERAIFILGARQVGKTTLLKRLMEVVGRHRSLYYDLEIPSNLEIFSSPIETMVARFQLDREPGSGRTFIFLDEAQYAGDLSKTLKILVDHHGDEFKFVLTGSSALQIKHQFSESLVGRKEIMVLHPLSFAEFCLFKGEEKIVPYLDLPPTKNNPLLTLTDRLEALLGEYIIFGGFPDVVNQDGKKRKIELLNDIVSSYVLKDIKHILRLEKIQELNRMIRFLAWSIGKEINISELSRNVGLHRETVDKYLLTLEESFIISILRPFTSNLDKELRKMPKIYLTDTGIRNMLANNFNELDRRADRGELVENLFYLNLHRNKQLTASIGYWKTKEGKEVDFVKEDGGDIHAYEVKYGQGKSAGFSSFKKTYPEAKCSTVRFKYRAKQGELPLWHIPRP